MATKMFSYLISLIRYERLEKDVKENDFFYFFSDNVEKERDKCKIVNEANDIGVSLEMNVINLVK